MVADAATDGVPCILIFIFLVWHKSVGTPLRRRPLSTSLTASNKE